LDYTIVILFREKNSQKTWIFASAAGMTAFNRLGEAHEKGFRFFLGKKGEYGEKVNIRGIRVSYKYHAFVMN
jgi:hypothetical protein